MLIIELKEEDKIALVENGSSGAFIRLMWKLMKKKEINPYEETLFICKDEPFLAIRNVNSNYGRNELQ